MYVWRWKAVQYRARIREMPPEKSHYARSGRLVSLFARDLLAFPRSRSSSVLFSVGLVLPSSFPSFALFSLRPGASSNLLKPQHCAGFCCQVDGAKKFETSGAFSSLMSCANFLAVRSKTVRVWARIVFLRISRPFMETPRIGMV